MLHTEDREHKQNDAWSKNHTPQEPPASPHPLLEVFLFHNLHVRLRYRRTTTQEKGSNFLKVPIATKLENPP